MSDRPRRRVFNRAVVRLTLKQHRRKSNRQVAMRSTLYADWRARMRPPTLREGEAVPPPERLLRGVHNRLRDLQTLRFQFRRGVAKLIEFPASQFDE